VKALPTERLWPLAARLGMNSSNGFFQKRPKAFLRKFYYRRLSPCSSWRMMQEALGNRDTIHNNQGFDERREGEREREREKDPVLG
jgi:hypothetical protein